MHSEIIKPSILLVDDESSITKSLQRELRGEGYNIYRANSGEEGLSILQENSIDVIISDQRMPKMTGSEFLNRVQELYPDTVRILLSGYSDFQGIVDAINKGAIYKFWVKPWDREFLIDQVRHAVDKAISNRERSLQMKQSEYLKSHDAITGLPNREGFNEQIKVVHQDSLQGSGAFTILSLAIKRFESLQENLEPAALDSILNTFADRLHRVLPYYVELSCIGKGRFALAYFSDTDISKSSETVESLVDLIVDQLRSPIELEGKEWYLDIQTGGVLVSSLIEGETFDENIELNDQLTQWLIQQADHSKKLAKEKNKRFLLSSINLNNSQPDLGMQENWLVEHALPSALQNERFTLVYQPIIDAQIGSIKGVEALMRWEHPLWGAVSPEKFIPVAEETGLINQIGEWCLRTACMQVKTWQEAGFSDLTLAVNVSACQIMEPDFYDTLCTVLEETKFLPHLLELELTETFCLSKDQEIIDIMHRINALGVRLVLDDFGTGYASMRYLHDFPFAMLKIDRSFVRDIVTQEHNLALLESILLLANRLRLEVVVEGVENEEQFEFLSGTGCDYMQGYYLCKPVEPEVFFEMLCKDWLTAQAL